MIDWFGLAANTLWVLGCALVLAVLSYASWEASETHERFPDRLRRPTRQAALQLGGLLFACGLAGTSAKPLEIGIWLLLAAVFLLQLIATIRKARAAAEHA